mgnify:CR=1 FL=1
MAMEKRITIAAKNRSTIEVPGTYPRTYPPPILLSSWHLSSLSGQCRDNRTRRLILPLMDPCFECHAIDQRYSRSETVLVQQRTI